MYFARSFLYLLILPLLLNDTGAATAVELDGAGELGSSRPTADGDPCPSSRRSSSTGRLLTVAGVGFLAGGALTIQDPLASALLNAI
mmetsp:Transcript_93444/g.166282  ORF Transcript_93444/g.166282 Transcript_93444/m.166282 type:complete len:87 (-) Transcript_93444:180-440(-)